MTVVEAMQEAKRWLRSKENEGWNLTDLAVFAMTVTDYVLSHEKSEDDNE